MIDPQDLCEWVDRQLGYTHDHLRNPLDVPTFPTPDFWEGYKSALESVRDAVRSMATKPS